MNQSDATLKRTALYARHRDLKGKIIEFGGWEMPVDYAGILAEHRAVRTAAGIFDLSHMGEIDVTGPNALPFINNIITNDAAALVEGQICYTAACKEDGGILDDLLVYRLPEKWMLVVNASNTDKMVRWCHAHAGGGVTVRDVTQETALIAVQGPKAEPIVQAVTRDPLAQVGYYHVITTQVAGIPAIVSRTGYTGEDGFEVYVSSASAQGVWDVLMEAGERWGLAPAGLGARDTLRLECAYCLYGHEIDEDHHPLEAGLGWVVKLGKEDFIGKSALAAAKAAGLSRKLVGIQLAERGVPRQGYAVTRGGAPGGVVTSGAIAPTLNTPIALAYVPVDWAAQGTPLEVVIRDRSVPAAVVPLPFYKGSAKR